MCGIAGFIDPSASTEARESAVLRMCNTMIHRGPDDSGIESRGPATVGMRRLAIFDPANGHQPMSTSDGRYTLVFNGAIYNFQSLKAELESSGWVFRTRCDTEVLLAALAVWGEKALGRLRGMFAFALWDSTDQSVLIARDPFGIKPLYFSHNAQRIVFASEVGALLVSGVCGSDISPTAVAEYLGWFAVPAPSTIYKGILSLQPGESLIFKNGALKIQRYWSFGSIAPKDAPCTSRAEFIRELRTRLDDTISAHVLADVPVGAFLSGGLDSAVAVGLMSHAIGGPLKTFTIGFEEDGFSEADEAEATARHFGCVHHTRILTGDEVARDIDKFLGACDQPTGDGINTYYVSQTANEGGVKVALSGLGGDEIFGGYPSFKVIPVLAGWLTAWGSLPGSVRSLVTRFLNTRGTQSRKLSDFLSFAHDPHELGALQRRVFPESRRLMMLAPEVLEAIGSPSPFHPMLDTLKADVNGEDLFKLVSSWEIRTYMADILLRDSDVMSMRHSLELRVPFVDKMLVEWLWHQPSAFIYDRKRLKSALVDATADLLPQGLMNRKKRGFTFPFPIWMRNDLRPFLQDTFATASISKSGLFAAGPIRSLWDDFLAGTDNREWSRIWSLAVLISFVNRSHARLQPQGLATS